MFLNVTMTAMNRRELINTTVSSFYHNLLRNFKPVSHRRFIMNIDPLPDKPTTAADIESIINIVDFYDFTYAVNTPEEANFGEAFKWCWSLCDVDWVFNLEDDWELLRPVDIKDLILIMQNNPDLASLRLPQFRSDADGMKNWNLWFPWNGEFFECPDDLRVSQGFCGHPSLIRGEFVKKCAPLIDPTKNPEKQFHHGNPALVEEVAKWRFGVYGKPNESNYIQDLGRRWMVDNGYRKSGAKAYFMNWEKHTEGG